MRKIRGVLRLKLEARLSCERIAVSLGKCKGVVAKYVSLAVVAGLDWPTVQTLSDTALERSVVQGRRDRPTHYVLPNYARAHRELRRKCTTLMLLPPRAADLSLQPVLRTVSTLRTAFKALNAADPSRRREVNVRASPFLRSGSSWEKVDVFA